MLALRNVFAVARPTTTSRVLAARFMSTTPDVPAPVAGGAGELEKAQSWDNQPVVAPLSGVPDEHLQRKARIFRPARTAMSQGMNSTKLWRLEFGTRERWENPIMGWSSSGDPLSNLLMDFSTKEDAVAFAKKSGFDVEIREPHQKKMQRKSYGDNYSWSKRTRVGQK